MVCTCYVITAHLTLFFASGTAIAETVVSDSRLTVEDESVS